MTGPGARSASRLDGNDAFARARILQAPGGLLKVVHFRGGEIVYDSDDTLVLSMGLTSGHALEYRTGTTRTRVIPLLGRFGLMTPGRRFDIALQGDCSVLQMVLPRRLLVGWLEEDHAIDARRAEILWGHSLDDPAVARSMVQAWLGDEDERRSVLRDIATRLYERFSERPGPLACSRGGLAPGKLRRVLEWIEDDHTGALAVDDLARAVALSPFHFARQFRRTTGRSPHRFIVERRVSRAIQLMRNEDLSIARVADRSGFANTSHLARQTRRILGQSPAAIRRVVLS